MIDAQLTQRVGLPDIAVNNGNERRGYPDSQLERVLRQGRRCAKVPCGQSLLAAF